MMKPKYSHLPANLSASGGVQAGRSDLRAEWTPSDPASFPFHRNRFPVNTFVEIPLPKALRCAFHHAPHGMVISNAGGIITRVNEAAQRLAQLDPTGISLRFAPRIWGEMFDPQDHAVRAEQWPAMRALRGETVAGEEYRLVRDDGETCYLLIGAAPLRMKHTIVGAVLTLMEVTHQKRLALRSRRAAVRNERRRMAGDLHDTLSQSLNALVLQLEVAQHHLPKELEQVRRHFQRAQEMARQSLADARRSMWTLTQESLPGDQIATALSLMTKRLLAGTSIELDLLLEPGTQTLPRKWQLQLLRIGREAVTNVLKHARATRIQVGLCLNQRDLELSVQDNGRGFAGSQATDLDGGFGLSSMRERAQRMGGSLFVHSRPGFGTRIVAMVPIAGKTATAAAASVA